MRGREQWYDGQSTATILAPIAVLVLFNSIGPGRGVVVVIVALSEARSPRFIVFNILILALVGVGKVCSGGVSQVSISPSHQAGSSRGA